MKKAKAVIDQFDQKGKGDQEKWIEFHRRNIVEHHFNHNSFYRACVGNQLPKDFDQLPVLKKKDLQIPIRELVSRSFSLNEVYISNTSGSSGNPFFFAKDKFAHALTWAFIWNKYNQLNIEATDLQARFYGIPLNSPTYLKERFKDFLMNRWRFPVFDMGEKQMEQFFEVFKRRKFRYIYGYTNSILMFSKFVRQKGVVLIDVCPTLKRCIVTSEVCTEEDKLNLEEVFGVPITREYGASELDVIAIEDQVGVWRLNESNLFVEVLSDDYCTVKEGEEGRLVITSLHNKAMPFIRYDIGDIGVIVRDNGGSILKRLSGRVNDTIVLPSGRKSPGLTFYYISRSILESGGVIKEFIIRQTTLSHFEFEVVSDRQLRDTEIHDIKLRMDQYLEPGLTLSVKKVDKIIRPASGKIKHFYSQIN